MFNPSSSLVPKLVRFERAKLSLFWKSSIQIDLMLTIIETFSLRGAKECPVWGWTGPETWNDYGWTWKLNFMSLIINLIGCIWYFKLQGIKESGQFHFYFVTVLSCPFFPKPFEKLTKLSLGPIFFYYSMFLAISLIGTFNHDLRVDLALVLLKLPSGKHINGSKK